MSVETATARRPNVGDLLGHIVEALGGSGGQHQVGAGLGASPRQCGAQ
jgi:hypothetical protein